ncbi:MAG: hypothetical protein LBQ79_02615 [Deltaproteobacteria bacterium]|jgi:hypothetical protein|nr:hypothetical protein [Deltaproteobacteria bacterium]
MKIFPFGPPPGNAAPPARAPAAAGCGAEAFEKFLTDGEGSPPSACPPKNPAPPQKPLPAWTAVGSENARARESTSELDLQAAAGLLSGLIGSVKAVSSEALAKVHRLDGVLYYFQV